MNKFIFGFNQELLIEHKLDFKDMVLLKYINDVILKKSFLKKTIDGEIFYWIKMDGILEAYPKLDLSKDAIRRRLRALVSKKFLDYRLVHGNGTFSFYKKGELLESIYREGFCRLNTPGDDIKAVEIIKTDTKITNGLKSLNCEGEDVVSVCENKTGATVQNIGTNNSNNKHSFNKNILYINKTVDEVVDYINLKMHKKYSKSNTQTIESIKNLISDGYELNDFKAVVDIKYDEWKGTEYEKYVRPYTLFKRDRFENYLNQGTLKKNKERENIQGFVEG